MNEICGNHVDKQIKEKRFDVIVELKALFPKV